MIEIFNRVLKSGCRVEKRRFEEVDRLLRCLAVYLIVAWRTLYLTRLGRSCPDIDCEAVFDPAEWQSVYQVVKDEKPPKQPPKLQEMVRMIARLGGYVSRKRDDEPGPQTMWLGLQRMHEHGPMLETPPPPPPPPPRFGPGKKKEKHVSR